MFTRIIFTTSLLGILWACETAPTPESASTVETVEDAPAPETVPMAEAPVAPEAPPYVARLEAAHQKEQFLQHEAVQFDLSLSFGGRERFNGTITVRTNSTEACLAFSDGRRLLYKGSEVYAPAAMATPDKKNSTRFGAYTWAYFFLFPYKLNDPGTQWADVDFPELNGTPYETQKLTFEAGTGDDPEDWYITYAHPEQYLIEAAAYIVTAGKTQAKAEEDPHAIQYADFNPVEGIPMAHRWTFWGWRAEQGLTDQLGEGTISNIQFITPSDETFAVPEGHVTL